jgi:gas vesicle protein
MVNDNDSDVSAKLTYLLIGGGIGAILALLFAPKSGLELRGDIADVTRKGIDRTRETATQIQNRAGEYYETTRNRAGELYETTRDRAGEIYSTATEKAADLAEVAKSVAANKGGQIQAAFDAGKRAYVDEKRRTESSSMIDGAPTYPEKG